MILAIAIMGALAFALHYQPKEGSFGSGTIEILQNKPFISLVRIQTSLLTLTVSLGVNLEEILEILNFH